MENKPQADLNLKKTTAYTATRKLVLTGLLASALTVGKLALSFIPNVEVVTVLILVYATVFGRRTAVLAVTVFCTVEVLIYGFGTWVALYFIYWNSLALLACAVLKKPRVVAAIILAVTATFFFGVLDTAVNTVFAALGGVPSYQLLNLFAAYYIRGGWYYLVHIVSNAMVVGALYIPLCKTLGKLSGQQ